MTSIWRSDDFLRETAGANRFRAARHGLYMLFGLTCLTGAPGCAWVRAQAQHQSEECEKLCSQADVAKDAGRMDRADSLLNAALKKSPRDMEVQRQLADTLWDVGRIQESLTLLTQLADEHPRDVRLATTLAERLAELERYDEAMARLQTVLAGDPAATAALELKARLELTQENSDAALATYQKLGQQTTNQAAALLQMGSIYLARNQPERASPLLRAILTHPHASDRQRQEAHWRLGIAYAQGRRWSDAATHLAHAAAERQMSADDWHAVAYAQFRSDDLSAASDSLNHALGLEPTHPEALKLAGVVWGELADRTSSAAALAPARYQQVDATQRTSPP